MEDQTEIPREFEVGSEDLDPRIMRAARLAAEAAINRIPIQPKIDYHPNNGNLRWRHIAEGVVVIAICWLAD